MQRNDATIKQSGRNKMRDKMRQRNNATTGRLDNNETRVTSRNAMQCNDVAWQRNGTGSNDKGQRDDTTTNQTNKRTDKQTNKAGAT